MKYTPMIKDQPKEEPKEEPKPNYEAQAAAEKARREEMEKRVDEKTKDFERRQAEYDRQLEEVRLQQQPTQNNEQTQAIIDLGITEEDFIGEEKKFQTMKRIQDYQNAMRQEYQQTFQEAGKVLNSLAEDNHRLKVEALGSKDFYSYAKSDIESYYTKNPGAKIPGTALYESPESIYEKMVGKNWKSYYEKQAEDAKSKQDDTPPLVHQPRTYQETETPVTPAAPTGPSIRKKKTEEVTLTKEEMETLNWANSLDPELKMTPLEWRSIEQGKVLPTNISYKKYDTNKSEGMSHEDQ